jgi:GNAT superfamily N-acetyltransferase
VSVRVRRATVADAQAVASVHFHSWQAAVRGAVPRAALERMSLLDGELRWRARLSGSGDGERTFVISDGIYVVGFCRLCLPSPDDDADAHTAQLASMYVLPGRWRRGLGSKLLLAALRSLEPDVWREITLWALEISEQAQAFYAKHGFKPDGATDHERSYGLNGLRMRLPLTAPDQRWRHQRPLSTSRKTT